MAHLNIEQQVHDLNTRVERLEEHNARPIFARLSDFFQDITTSDILHIGGWILITISLLTGLGDLYATQTFSPILVFALILGLWLSFREGNWPHTAPSTKRLLIEQRTKHSIQAHQTHHSHSVSIISAKGEIEWLNLASYTLLVIGVIVLTTSYAWLVSNYLTSPGWQQVAIFLLPFLAIVYCMYAKLRYLLYLSIIASLTVLYLGSSVLVSMLGLTAVALVVVLYSWLKQSWSGLFLTAIGSYLVLANWSLVSGLSAARETLILLTILTLSLAFVLPFAWFRREPKGREQVRGIIFLSTLSLVILLPVLKTGLFFSFEWLEIICLYLVVLVGLGGVSLANFGHYSYAKYYGISALGVLLLISLLSGGAGLVTLLWLLIALLAFCLGFNHKSYSLRVTGLIVLGLTLLLYVVAVFPYERMLYGIVVLQERIWVGVVVLLMLPLISLWYKDLPAAEPEHRDLTIIIETITITSLAMAFGLIWVGMQPPLETLTACVVGLIYFLWAKRQQLAATQAVAIASVLSFLVKFFLLDTLSLSDQQRMLFLVAFAAVVVLTAVLLLHLAYARQFTPNQPQK